MKNMPEKRVVKLVPERTQDKIKRKFTQRIVHGCVVACSLDISDRNADLDEAQSACELGLAALGAENGLQQMLAAQMLSIHQFQQMAICMASNEKYNESKKYYTNTAIKLSNAFVQQANLLAKLQGDAGQKFIVERVEISNGGQAVIGTVNGGVPADKEKM